MDSTKLTQELSAIFVKYGCEQWTATMVFHEDGRQKLGMANGEHTSPAFRSIISAHVEICSMFGPMVSIDKVVTGATKKKGGNNG